MLVFAYTLSILFMILLPVVLAACWRRRFAVPWWLFCLGILTFVGSQVYHLPLNRWLSDAGFIGPVASDAPNIIGTALVLGLSAGLSESLARAIGYWLLFRYRKAQQWADSVMVGLGHGGIEAMVIGGVLTAATVSSLWALRGVDLETLGLAPEQLVVLQRQMALFTASPAIAIAPLLERAIAMAAHVIFSVLVWLAFKRRNALYFVVAVLYHTLFDATAVYLVAHVENFWLIEGAFALLLAPGLFWLWRTWPADAAPARRLMPWTAEWRLFGAAVGKELRQQWRTKRILVVLAVFAVFGMLSPLIARFTPEILRSVEGAEMFADLIPEPTAADAITQYIQNITQFGFILAVLLGMGAVAGEKEQGTTAMILSKPMPRWAFILSKFVAQALVYVLAFAIASVAAYYYTLFLFEPLALGLFLFGNVLLLLWLLTFAAVTLLGSTIANSTSAAAGIALGGSILLFLAGSLPQVGALAPAGLVAWASQLGLPAAEAAPANAGALAAAVVLIVVLLITAVAVFETQEL